MNEPATLHWAVPIPARSGRVVGICNWQGRVIIACEYDVYEYIYVNMMPKLMVINFELCDFTDAAIMNSEANTLGEHDWQCPKCGRVHRDASNTDICGCTEKTGTKSAPQWNVCPHCRTEWIVSDGAMLPCPNVNCTASNRGGKP